VKYEEKRKSLVVHDKIGMLAKADAHIGTCVEMTSQDF
jgi:hypothetical protein